MCNKKNQIKRISQKRRLATHIPYREIEVSPIVDLFLLVFFMKGYE